MYNILTFAGFRKSGKTTAAEIVCSLDSRFEILSFAKPMKDMFAAKYNVPRHILDDVMGKEQYRHEMQEFGDLERAKNRYVFALAARDSMIPGRYYTLDDERYIEELEVMVKLGAISYGIFAETYKRADRGWVANPDVDNHVSELELGSLSQDTWAALGGGMIYNNGTKEQLKDSVFRVLRRHFPIKCV